MTRTTANRCQARALRPHPRRHTAAAARGHAATIATPCTSFSVARGNHEDGCVHVGLRTFSHESGPPEASEAAKAFVRKHDVFVDFTVDVADAALALDLDLIIENPAPRNDPSLASSWPARAHLPQLWDMRRVRELRARHALSLLVADLRSAVFHPSRYTNIV